MKIELLNIDGLSCAAEGWRLSREVDVPVEWDDVFTVDCPVNELPSCLIHLRDLTILEREIIATSRTHVMWARTSFVDRPDKYALPTEMAIYADPVKHRSFVEKMIDGQHRGLHQDEWRQDLPVMAVTSFVCRAGFRDLVKLCLYFEYLGHHPKVNPILCSRFWSVAEELKIVIDKFTGKRALTQRALDGMRLVKFLHEGHVAPYEMRSTYNYWLVGMEMPLWLRAHFVRHRPLSFVDDLFRILCMDDVIDRTIHEPVTMDIGTTKDFWRTLLGKRGCWLTQSTLSVDKDPWAKIIEEFGVVGIEVLPCSNGECPHHKDARLRLEGRDPGCPCPRYMRLNGIDAAPFRDRIEQAIVSRPEFWRKELNS